jgi:hypothetical protein
MKKLFLVQLLIIFGVGFLGSPNGSQVLAEDIIRDIEFPVDGPHTLTDTFGAPRSGGRVHEGVDILADKMVPLVSAVDGVVHLITMEERDWGFGVFIRDADGYSYRYIHVNNDTPGTDDGQGGALYAFPATIFRGAKVSRGQLVGWVGDSGNAENVTPHLHFEVRTRNGVAIDPYPSLLLATSGNSFDPAKVRLRSPNINEDKNLDTQSPSSVCQAGELVKIDGSDAVYYCGADGRRYVFPTARVYASWFKDFSGVVTVSPEELSALRIGGNVTYRPGERLVKIETDPKTYAVDQGGVLRWVTSSEIAESMYGSNWNTQVDDISPAFFINYTIGEPITAPLP